MCPITTAAKIFLLCALVYVNQVTAHPSDTAPRPAAGTDCKRITTYVTAGQTLVLTNLTDICHILYTEGLLTRDKTIKAV